MGYPVKKYYLPWNDDRRAIQLPMETLYEDGGQTPNPRVVLGDNNWPDGTQVAPAPAETLNGLGLYLRLKNEMSTLTIAPEQTQDVDQTDI